MCSLHQLRPGVVIMTYKRNDKLMQARYTHNRFQMFNRQLDGFIVDLVCLLHQTRIRVVLYHPNQLLDHAVGGECSVGTFDKGLRIQINAIQHNLKHDMEVSPHELIIIIKILNEIIDVSQWIGDVVDEGYLAHHGKGQTFNDRIHSPFIQVVTIPTQHPSEFELDTFRGKRVTIFHDLFHV